VSTDDVATDPDGDGRLLAALVGVSTLTRLAISASIPLSVDECYAVVMGRRLALGYFDHPPMMFWLAGTASRVLGTESPLAVRLPFVMLAAASTCFIYLLGARLFTPRAGLIAAVLLSLTLFYGPCGGWVLPDVPLACFMLLGLFCLTRALWGTPKAARAWWCAFGVAGGLALLSKYHAIFLFAGVFAFLASARAHRHWLRRPDPWLAAAIAAAVFSPVIVWNELNGWASFRFQGGRAVALVPGGGSPLFDSIGGQALWLTPAVWVGLVFVLGSALAAGPRFDRRWLLTCVACGPIFAFTGLNAMGTRGLAHWALPGYLLAVPLLGAAIDERLDRRFIRRSFAAGAALALCLAGLLVYHARVGLPTPTWMRKDGDPTNDLLAWDDVAREVHRYQAMYPEAHVVGRWWVDAAKIAHALGPDVPVTAVGEDPRGFHFVADQAMLLGQDLLLVDERSPRRSEAMVAYAPYCRHVTGLESLPVRRGEDAAFLVSLYRCQTFLAPMPERRGRR
jgi:4-amino-4-deoxy-L-arabinose transferase-like glycosyltransferase